MSASGRRGLRAWLRRRVSTGTVETARTLLFELRLQRRHRRSVQRARALRDQRHLKVHLGSGPKLKAGWINVDLAPSADLQLDLREPLPFADGSVAIVYSEHFFEHIGYPGEAMQLLRECRRVLEPGGTFSVGVPDAEELLQLFARGELRPLLRTMAEDDALRWMPRWVWKTPMHFVNFSFRQNEEHKYLYDHETLAEVLTEAGFVAVRRRPWDPALDSADRADGTLYVDATNPG